MGNRVKIKKVDWVQDSLLLSNELIAMAGNKREIRVNNTYNTYYLLFLVV